MKSSCDYLILDISNLLYRSFYVDKGEDAVTINGMATHVALTSLNSFYREYRPKKRIIMAFDRHSWRKDYTASPECVSKKPYKGHRRQNLTPAEAAKYESFQQHLREFENLMNSHTTVITLAQDKLEADDLIAVFCQMHLEDSIIVITSDSDMAQLFKYNNVQVISPANRKLQSLDKYNNDPHYYLFNKCMRGDRTDNVQSAYPRLRSTRIEEAYADSFKLANLLKETWTDQNKVTYVVEDIFKENQLLIDLEKQPEYVRKLMEDTISEAVQKESSFSLFYMLKYLKKYELAKITETIDQFVPMLSHKIIQ
jgi:hypothetical protein